MRSFPKKCFVFGIAVLLAFSAAFAQKIDEGYTKKIREFTTDPHFSTKYVDYLPASATGVPRRSPSSGHIIGAPNILSYSQDVYKYFDALDKASPRVKVFRLGQDRGGPGLDRGRHRRTKRRSGTWPATRT